MPEQRREYSYDDLFPERWLHAPDIDGRTVVRGGRAQRGDLLHAVATGSLGYDVEAVAGTGEP